MFLFTHPTAEPSSGSRATRSSRLAKTTPGAIPAPPAQRGARVSLRLQHTHPVSRFLHPTAWTSSPHPRYQHSNRNPRRSRSAAGRRGQQRAHPTAGWGSKPFLLLAAFFVQPAFLLSLQVLGTGDVLSVYTDHREAPHTAMTLENERLRHRPSNVLLTFSKSLMIKTSRSKTQILKKSPPPPQGEDSPSLLSAIHWEKQTAHQAAQAAQCRSVFPYHIFGHSHAASSCLFLKVTTLILILLVALRLPVYVNVAFCSPPVSGLSSINIFKRSPKT